MRPLIIPDPGHAVDFKRVPVAKISEFEGLVTIGANLLPETLLSAYREGLFPWYRYNKDYYWYCPDPRLVLYPGDLHVSRSLSNFERKHKFRLSSDLAFEQTMRSCAGIKRKHEEDTWIDESFIDAYTRLHGLGYAHSFETWQGDELVGGLYGIAIGKIFFGESMFTRESNASKLAFTAAVKFLHHHGFQLIDCQVKTAHLQRFGAITISKLQYLSRLKELTPPHILDGINWRILFDQTGEL